MNPLKLLQWARAAENASGAEGSAKYFYDASKALQPGKLAPLSDAETERLIRAAQSGHNRIVGRLSRPEQDERHLLAMRDNWFELPGAEKGFHVDMTPGYPAARVRQGNRTKGPRVRPLSVAVRSPVRATDRQANEAEDLLGFRRSGADTVIYTPTEGELAPTRLVEDGEFLERYAPDSVRDFIYGLERRPEQRGLFQPSAAILKPENVRDLFEAEFKNPKATGLGYARGGRVKSNKSEIEALLRKYPNPNDVRYAPQVEGKGNELRRQFPGTYGAIGGFMGTAPDEFERGSVLDTEDAAIDAQVRKGAELGYPVGLAASVAPIFSGIGQLAAKYAPVAARNAMAPTQLSKQAGVIKMKGGNWLSDSVENALKGLKQQPPVISGQIVDEVAGAPLFDAYRAHYNAGNENVGLARWLEQNHPDIYAKTVGQQGSALNAWIDKQLTRYVKNEMATPEDPIRALAERGVLHVNPEELNFQTALHGKYMEPGQTAVAKSDAAKTWEGASDMKVANDSAADVLAAYNKDYSKDNPWLLKVPPDTRVHGITESHMAPDLGFNHLIDELRNATDPRSGLPADLLLKYDALDKVSVPQAVERVAKINAWREAQAANAKQALLEGIPVHKEYPEGFRWLKVPDTLDNPAALKYAEESGCVGKWCTQSPAAAERYGGGEGGRLFQLVDKKGEPHVQIQVALEPLSSRTNVFGRTYEITSPYDYLTTKKGLTRREIESAYGADFPQMDRKDALARVLERNPRQGAALKKLLSPESRPLSIKEIKGKANRAPNPEYLPYVQDFVKSGKWSDVGDLQNTGLRRSRDVWNDAEQAKIRAAQKEFGEYVMPEDIEQINRAVWPDDSAYNFKIPPTQGYAQGGRVTAKPGTNKADCGCDHKGYAAGGLVDYDPGRIDAIAQQLRAELAL